jgi:uncharacterized integral membrane protein
MLRALVVLLVVLELAATAVYALQNQATTAVTFLNMRWTGVTTWWPAAAAILVMLATCILYGFVSGIGWRVRHHRLSRHVDEHQATAEQLQRENAALRERLSGRPRTTDERPVEPSIER